MCVDWYGANLATEHLSILGSKSHERLWIHPTQHNITVKRRIRVVAPTLLLNGPHHNPGHQFWDVLVNLFELDGMTPPFTHWAAPSCAGGDWMCDLLPTLLDVLGLRLQRSLQDSITNEQVLCFTKLWIPMFGIYREERTSIPNEGAILRRLHSALVSPFHEPASTVVVYGKQDLRKSKRQWQNAARSAVALNSTGDVRYVQDMGALTFKSQCHLFWSARHLVYVHGGHTANLICARPGTRVDELACPREIGWSQFTKIFHNSLGFRYQYHSVPGCTKPYNSFNTSAGWLADVLGRSNATHSHTQSR